MPINMPVPLYPTCSATSAVMTFWIVADINLLATAIADA